MVMATDAAAAARTRFSRRPPEGALIWRSDYFGPPPSPTGSNSVDPKAANDLDYVDPAPGEVRPPQAFLVAQEPGAVVQAHFHFVDQFQVAVDGGGWLGLQPLSPITVHFAGACTGYGPIRPGPDGLKYFTLRASADSTGAQFMPAARAKLRRDARRRHVMTDPLRPSSPEELAARREPVLETAHSEPDGLAVMMLRLPPGGRFDLPDPAAGVGQSLLVAAGALEHEGAPLGRWSALFVAPDEGAYAAQAGPGGAELLVLQYPRAP